MVIPRAVKANIICDKYSTHLSMTLLPLSKWRSASRARLGYVLNVSRKSKSHVDLVEGSVLPLPLDEIKRAPTITSPALKAEAWVSQLQLMRRVREAYCNIKNNSTPPKGRDAIPSSWRLCGRLK